MTINRNTKLSEILSQYPRLKESLPMIHNRFKMIGSPLIKANNLNIADMSRYAEMEESALIDKLHRSIAKYNRINRSIYSC